MHAAVLEMIMKVAVMMKVVMVVVLVMMMMVVLVVMMVLVLVLVVVLVVMVMVFDKRVRVVHLGGVEQLIMKIRFVMSIMVLVVEPAIMKLSFKTYHQTSQRRHAATYHTCVRRCGKVDDV